MTLEEFAKALFSSTGECEIEFNDSGKVGTQGEHKEELVPIPKWEKRDKAGRWKDAALAPFLVDGWYPRGSDIENFTHRHVVKNGKDYQSVVFFRNVPKLKDQDAQP